VKSVKVCLLLACLVFAAAPAAAAWQRTLDFEDWSGPSGSPIGSAYPGIAFSTQNGDVCYLRRVDCASGLFMDGCVAACAANEDDVVRIDFARCASLLRIGYSCDNQVVLEAYNRYDELIDIMIGDPNTAATGGAGLAYLEVQSNSGMAYAKISGIGAYGLFDNVTYEVVPEPATMVGLGLGVVAVALLRRGRR